MKQIFAVFPSRRMEQVQRALHSLVPFPGFTLLRGSGQSHGQGAAGGYVPSEADLDEHLNSLLFIVCRDDQVQQIVALVRAASYTGLPGDGVIVVSNVEYMTHIGERPHDGPPEQLSPTN